MADLRIEDYDDDLEVRRSMLGLPAVQDQKIHVDQMDPQAADLIRKTVAQIPNISSHTPHSLDMTPSLVDRASLELPNQTGREELIAELGNLRSELVEMEGSGSLQFPRLAWEAVQLGLAKEAHVNAQINGHVNEANKIQKDIDLLLDLSQAISAMPDGAEQLSQEVQDILSQLKERDIDLWKTEDMSANKEKISELKRNSSSQVDKLRSNLQIIFTTKIQVLIQTIGSIMEILKNLVNQNSRLMHSINQKMSGRG